MASIVKRLSRHEGVRGVLCWLGAQYIRLCHATGRWSETNGAVPRRLWEAGQPFILCFWHGRLMMMPYCWDPRRPIHTLTSEHPDGRLIARTTAHFGLRTVTGSSSRGGSAALRRLLRLVAAGSSVAITPDGPRGPRMRAQDGAIGLARMAGVPIVPVSYSTERRRLLKSWDRFLLVLPFGRGVIVWGDPIAVPGDADAEAREAARRQLEDSLNALTGEADRRCGHAPVEPAEAP